MIYTVMLQTVMSEGRSCSGCTVVLCLYVYLCFVGLYIYMSIYNIYIYIYI